MRRFALIAAALMLSATAVAPALLPARAAATQNYDFSDPNDATPATADAVDLLRDLDLTLSDVEIRYLAAHTDFTLKYTPAVPVTSVDAPFEEGGDLKVTASPYSYRAANGTEVTWNPISIDDGGTMSANGKLEYTTTPAEGQDYVTVRYESAFQIGAEDVNSLLTMTYDAGMVASETIKTQQKAYEDALAEYQAAVRAHDQYEADLAAYNANREKYEAYLRAYDVWAGKRAQYQDYLARSKQYDADLAAYQKAQADHDAYTKRRDAYVAYLEEMKEYDEAYAAYLAKLDSEEALRQLQHLKILDYIFLPVTNMKRTVGDSILGDTVVTVLERRKELNMAGVSNTLLDIAIAATTRLRANLKTLKGLKKDIDRYSFYISNYETLTKDFCDLLRCLDYLYQNPDYQLIHDTLQNMAGAERVEKYRILLAQLYYLCAAMTDGRVTSYRYEYNNAVKEKYTTLFFNDNYTIDGKKPFDVLEKDPNGALEDLENAVPTPGTGFILPESPPKPDPVEEPGKEPVVPPLPTKPEPVADPGPAPAEVKPLPVPMPVAEPGDAPVAYTPTAEEAELNAALAAGLLSPRSELVRTEAYPFKREASVRRYFRNATETVVHFWKGDEELYSASVERGSYIQYPYATLGTPMHEREGYNCEFDGWVDGAGNPFELSEPLDTDAADLDLYAHFRETAMMYTVWWKVNGVNRGGRCAYDDVPVYDETLGPLTHDPEGVRQYYFMGWQGEDGTIYSPDEDGVYHFPIMTTRTVVYTAVFERGAKVTFNLAKTTYTLSLREGEIPVCPHDTARERDNKYRYTFLGWQSGADDEILTELPAVHWGDTLTYTAMYKRTPLVEFSGEAAEVTYSDGYYVADCRNGYENTFTLGTLISLAEEQGTGVRLQAIGFEALLDDVAVRAAANAGVTAVEIHAEQTRGDIAKFGIRFIGTGDTSACSAVIVTHGDYAGRQLLRIAGDEITYMGYDYSAADRRLRFTMESGIEYELSKLYTITMSEGPLTVFSDLPAVEGTIQARAKDTVTLRLGELAVGKRLASVFVFAGTGTEPLLSWTEGEEFTFAMPEGDVSVTARIVDILYKIRFFAEEGKLLYEREVTYGTDLTEIAPNAMKPSDGTHVYTFTGWDPLLAPVTGDADYYAQFSESEAPPLVEAPSRLTKILDILYVAVPVGLAVFVLLIVLLIVWLVLRRRKKKRLKAAAAAKTASDAPMPATHPSAQPAAPKAVPAERPVAPKAIPAEKPVAPKESRTAARGTPASPATRTVEPEPMRFLVPAPQEIFADVAPAPRKPAKPAAKPVQPVKPAEKPAKPVEKPIEVAEKPVEVAEKPVEAVVEPVEAVEIPEAAAEAPAMPAEETERVATEPVEAAHAQDEEVSEAPEARAEAAEELIKAPAQAEEAPAQAEEAPIEAIEESVEAEEFSEASEEASDMAPEEAFEEAVEEAPAEEENGETDNR